MAAGTAVAQERPRISNDGTWTAVGEGRAFTMLVRRAPPGNVYPRVWERQELWESETDDQGSYLSTLSLQDVDCSQQRYRVVQFTSFTGQNMGGRPTPDGAAASQWRFVVPGSVGASAMEWACADN